eukprot:403363877
MQDFNQSSNIAYNTPYVELWNQSSTLQKNYMNASTIDTHMTYGGQGGMSSSGQGKLNNPAKYKEKQEHTEQYMRQFETIISETIKSNNAELNYTLKTFIFQQNLNPKTFEQQVPTCLVVTNSESASSIDTQFQTLCEELTSADFNSINLVLDEKKCGNMKQTIDHIQYKLKCALGIINDEYDMDIDSKEELKNSIKVKIQALDFSESDSDEDDFYDQDEVNLHSPMSYTNVNNKSHDFVSSIQDPNLNYSVQNQSMDSVMMNQSLESQSIQDIDLISNRMSDLQMDSMSNRPSTNNQKNSVQQQHNNPRFTRNRQKQMNTDKNAGIKTDKEVLQKAKNKNFEQFCIASDIMMKDSFFGIRKLVLQKDIEQKRPIIIIIRNIKTFQSNILNDLIHIIHKFRASPYKMKLNLMLGVQNNNKDEFHLRVKIQNCVKMTVKTFYFPCMKNIIYEAIYTLILSPKFIFMYTPEVMQNIVEIINLYGMSIMKFKRILKFLLAQFFMKNEFFFIHENILSIKNSKSEDSIRKQIGTTFQKGLNTYFKQESQFKEVLGSLKIFPDNSRVKQDFNDQAMDQTKSFCLMKRKWLKAYSFLENIVRNLWEKQEGGDSKISNKDKNIFNYQFMLNFLTKTQEERLKFLQSNFELVGKYETYVLEILIPYIKSTIEDSKKPPSTMRQEQLHELIIRIDGTLGLQKQIDQDNQRKTHVMSLTKMSTNRKDKLLNKKQAEPMVQETGEDLANKYNNETEEGKAKLRAKFRVTEEEGFKVALLDWLGQLNHKYFKIYQDATDLQKHLFFVQWNDANSILNPDIGGRMATSIIDSSKILKCECCDQYQTSSLLNNKVQKDGSNLSDCILPNYENMTIIMELYKYFGKEFNLVIAYDLFKKINMKIIEGKKQKYDQGQIRVMFLVAMQNLKYMGFFSPTKQSMFLFKKNFYGKAQQNSKDLYNSSKNDENDKNVDNIVKSLVKRS